MGSKKRGLEGAVLQRDLLNGFDQGRGRVAKGNR